LSITEGAIDAMAAVLTRRGDYFWTTGSALGNGGQLNQPLGLEGALELRGEGGIANAAVLNRCRQQFVGIFPVGIVAAALWLFGYEGAGVGEGLKLTAVL